MSLTDSCSGIPEKNRIIQGRKETKFQVSPGKHLTSVRRSPISGYRRKTGKTEPEADPDLPGFTLFSPVRQSGHILLPRKSPPAGISGFFRREMIAIFPVPATRFIFVHSVHRAWGSSPTTYRSGPFLRKMPGF
jgi:hypothetical protein